MTGKKITNASVKGRNSIQNAGNHQIGAAKSAGKQSAVVAADSSATTSTFGNIPLATAASTVTPSANLSTLIKMSENPKFLPRYTAALTKPATDLFAAEELDGVQLELELLLSTVSLRYRSLKSGFDSLDREDKTHKKNEKHASNAPGKKRKCDDNVKKTAKEAKVIGQPPKVAKVKTNASDSPVHSQHTDDSMDAFPMKNNNASTSQQNPKVLIPKNDIPNKFWLSVEPYCMPITQEDVKMLDDMIEEYSAPLVPPIPELGPHYTSRWAAEDIRDEQDNSNPNAKANKRFTNAANPEVTSMLKKGEKSMSEGSYGGIIANFQFSF